MTLQRSDQVHRTGRRTHAALRLRVFAPTNAAFDKLPAGTVDRLLEPENTGKLEDVLTYHVVAGRHDSKELMAWASP